MVRILVLAVLTLGAGIAHAECRPSASGQRSISVTLSPLSGRGCFDTVAVHAGAACEGEAQTSATFGCSEARRMVVTDEGVLVTLLADRASRRGWEIVRVFVREGDRLAVRSVRLEELPGLPADVRRPRLAIDARALTIDGALTVDVTALVGLGRVTARRRLR